MSARDRVLALLPDHAHAVVLESAGAVSWYLGGARVTVPLGGPSVVAVRVARDGDEVRCHLMEADRLRDEEGVADAVAVDWYDPLVPDDWARDPATLREDDLAEGLRAARAALTPAEVDRYARLGAEISAAVTAVAAATRPTDEERGVAGALADRVYSLGAEPVVLLVAGSARAGYRHPVPTAAPLGDRGMLVVGARRCGLIVNLTRWVQFAGTAPAEEAGLRRVEADVLDATVPGAELRAVLGTLRRAYARHGFDADEWRRHHQGGPTGYLGRDPKVTPAASGRVADRQVFAWNPTAPGVKAEDTVLATRDGIRLLTHDPAWPATDVAGRARPLTLHP